MLIHLAFPGFDSFDLGDRWVVPSMISGYDDSIEGYTYGYHRQVDYRELRRA